MNRATGNQHLRFTAEICMPDMNPSLPAKEDRVQIVTNDEFPFLDMKMSWSLEGDLKFGAFRNKGQQFKYVVKESTHTPGTLRAIPSGLLNRISELTSRKPSIHSEGVDKIYPDHTNALRKEGLAPHNLPKMGDLWSKQDEIVDIEK